MGATYYRFCAEEKNNRSTGRIKNCGDLKTGVSRTAREEVNAPADISL